MKRLFSLLLLLTVLRSEAANTLTIRAWNFTGCNFGQCGTGGQVNVICLSRDDSGDSVGGGSGTVPGNAHTYPPGETALAGNYKLWHRCVWSNGPSTLVMSKSWAGTTTETWDWLVFDDGCSSACTQTNACNIVDWNDRDPCRKECPSCTAGMPTWHVSEPYTSLWIHDQPFGYQPGSGPRVSLNLSYKQREDSAGLIANTFSLGKKWNFNWFGVISQISGTNYVLIPGGGIRTFLSSSPDYITKTVLTGAPNTGFTLAYPDGSQDTYGFLVTDGSGNFKKAFLSQRSNPAGQSTRLYYASYDHDNPVIRLQSIVDADGLTNQITYTNHSYSSNLIAKITDPFGHSCSFGYDTGGRLTSITDVVGIASSLLYDENDWVTNLTTPYGTNSFTYTDGAINGRSVLITEPDNSHQLYLYKDFAAGVTNTYSQLPSKSPFDGSFDNQSMNVRNTFYWGRQQYPNLHTTTIASFNAADFLKGRMRHWLKDGYAVVGEALSMERAPSPDGSLEGQKTWYDNANQLNPAYSGFQSVFPLFSATLLSDNTTRFTRTERTSQGGLPTIEIGTYTSNNAVALRTNVLTYSSDGLDVLSLTNSLGIQSFANVYNAYHQILTNYDALGQKTIYTYDVNHRPTSITLATGLITTNIYFDTGTDSNRLKTQIDYEMVSGSPVYYRTNSYSYTNGLLNTQTDPRGLIITNTWDALERLRRVDYSDGTFITNTYSNLDLTRIVDRMGFINSFGYDSLRRLIAATNANNVVTRYGYCSCGAVQYQTNAFGTPIQQIIQSEFDSQGRRTREIAADNYAVTYNYNVIGQITNVTDGFSSVTNTYNNQGLLVGSSNSFGRISAVIYDPLDRVTNSIDANSVTVVTTYDDINRVLTRTYPDNGIEKFGYSARGLTAYTNQLGFTNRYVYDALSRKTFETNQNGEITQFQYSPASDLTNLIDGKLQNTKWVYDTFGRVTNKTDNLGTNLFTYIYDPNSRLTNRASPAKGTTIYKYDPIGNLTNIIYPVSTNITLAYDSLNRLTNMVDDVGITSYSYDNANELQSEDGPWASDTVTYSYANRSRTGLSLAAPNVSTWTTSYSYDMARRLTNVTSSAGSFGYTYDSSRKVLPNKLVFPSSAYITNTYDVNGRLLSTILKSSGNSALSSHSYSYDPGNQRTQQVFTAGNYLTYTYDKSGQLVTALGLESGGTTNRWNEQFGYFYDAAGNLNRRTNNALVQTFNINSLNELTTATRSGTITVAGTTAGAATNVTVNTSNSFLYADSTFASTNQPLVDGNNSFTAIAKDSVGRSDTNTSTSYLPATKSFSYDLNGNLLSDGYRNFAYDDENQLISVWLTNSWRTDFQYDGKMRRRIRREYQWTAGTSSPTELVSSVSLGTLRNNFTGWVGFKLVVRNGPVLVTHLGRWVVSGNSAAHTVKIVKADGTDVPGATVSVTTSGAPTGQFKYVALGVPAQLAANSVYFVVTHEVSGGDTWYDLDCVLNPTPVGSVAGPVVSFDSPVSYTDYSFWYPSATYGPAGIKYASGWELASETRYVYDGNLVVQERDATNLVMVSYTRGNDLSGNFEEAGGIGGVLARTDRSSLLGLGSSLSHSYFAADGNGNITCLINTNQAIVASYLYDAFGNTVSQSGSIADENLYRFSSKEFHKSSGMYYYGYRFYDPNFSRWLSRDPIQEMGGLDLYTFAANAAISKIDPLGLELPVWEGSLLKGRPPSYDAPDPWKNPPQEVQNCCPKEEVDKGREQLNALFAQASDKLRSLGATPAPFRKDGATCLNSSTEIMASFFSSGKFPKCWSCRVEGRRGTWGIGQHAAIVCKSYSSDSAVQSQTVLYDWWGDQTAGTSNSGGSPDSFYSKYPNNSGPFSGTRWFQPYYTTCEGGMYQNEKGRPSPPDPPNWPSLVRPK